tara:strand:- start:1140 stop:1343 length:204 start_codon:yes stop_codon:yes gene_type:complete
VVGLALWFFKIFNAFGLGYFPLPVKGSMTTVPVDILLKKDGIIEKVYYGSNTTDHLKFDDIKTFSLS